ncbi:hypothetical protein [Rhizobium sp. IMFF44]|uniref:hypothetical protein n=1 Tax=unclassified Rhizobium TaxID=2613769 RepID=UPI0035B74EC0
MNDGSQKGTSTTSLATLVSARSARSLSGKTLAANDPGGNVGSRSSSPFWQIL